MKAILTPENIKLIHHSLMMFQILMAVLVAFFAIRIVFEVMAFNQKSIRHQKMIEDYNKNMERMSRDWAAFLGDKLKNENQ